MTLTAAPEDRWPAGVVFRATDRQLSEEIALKIFKPLNEDEPALLLCFAVKLPSRISRRGVLVLGTRALSTCLVGPWALAPGRDPQSVARDRRNLLIGVPRCGGRK